MPYKDPEVKGEWERQHSRQRLARRRELRRIEAARLEAEPEVPRASTGPTGLLLPLAAASALAAYNPKLAIGTGGLTLVVAAAYTGTWFLV